MYVGADISLKEVLKKGFGFEYFKGNQEAIIRNVIAGRDTFVLMPTGGGKSLCYQLPSVILEGTAIVISPLIALMKNQVDSMRNYSADDGVAHHLNSSLTKSAINQVRSDVLEGKTKLLYVAPESLTKQENIDFLKQIKVSFYAIDEAHCISEWGHDFRPVYRKIRPIVDEIGRAPIIALTATATPKVQHDILKNLEIQDANVFKSSFNRTNLYYEIRPKINATPEIIRYIKNNPGKSGIIYCLSRKKVMELSETLQVNGIKAMPYHAGLDSNVRSKTQDQFLMEEIDVIVATIAFGMGIDKPDIRYVIHYNIPKSLEGYYQETGRAGRDGGEGHCITFYSYKDIQKLEKFMQGKPVAEQEIGRQLLLETVSYAESSVCRRKSLLNYFGEEYEHENCETCDNCNHPKQKFEGKEYLVKVLRLIDKLNEKFKIDHIANILAGNAVNAVKSYRHHKLPEFDDDEGKDEKFWSTIVRQGMVRRFIIKDVESYGLLKLSERGRKYLNNPYSILLSEDHGYSNEGANEVGKASGTGAVDEELLNILKDLRREIARKHHLPPFIIFQDPSLEDMAIQYPTSMDEMNHITGVGAGKAQRYGKEFVELIHNYVQEKEIIRAKDMVVKSVVNKSQLKVFIIHSIDRQMSLEDIADSKNMAFDDLLNEIEAIVNSGTKLNIDYHINNVVDEDKQEDIFDYFRE
ncbi:MAG: DNA helicase RecQ, partial [Bacteroidota bacterium]